MNIHVHCHTEPDRANQDRLEQLLAQGATMNAALERLTTEVSEMKTAMGSAKTLLGTLATLIRDNASDPAALNALADDIDSETNALAAAVEANTLPEAGV